MVSRLRTFTSLLLLTLWLPVTQHCGLEAAEVLSIPGECHNASSCPPVHEQTACDADNCQSVEDSAYKPGVTKLKTVAPILMAVTCLCCLQDIAPRTIIVPVISPAQTDAPLELAPSWQFITRAAPSPRAPGFLA